MVFEEFDQPVMWKHTDAKQILLIGCPGIALTASACLTILFVFFTSRSIPLFFWLLAGLGLILLVWGTILIFQQKGRVADYQAKRDAAGKAIRDALLSGQRVDKPYFVYLRPFDIDNKFYSVPSSIPADHVFVEEYGWPTAENDLENVLANLVYQFGLLVAISDEPGEAGAAHVKAPDETWQEDVRAICQYASGIFVVPFDYEGTAWEIDLLVESGWIDKTFFVMPAEQKLIRGFGLKKITSDFRKLWADGRTHYKSLSLPAYDTRGGIIQMIDGEIKTYLIGSLSANIDQMQRVKKDIAALRSRLEELAKQAINSN